MSKKWQLLGSMVFFTLVLMLTGSADLHADSNWDAKYWNNKELSGNHVLHRSESEINYDWGHDSPHKNVNNNNFSARWKRTTYFDAGTYQFTATMDDGMRVWVDNQLIIDSWWDSQLHSMSATLNLAAGDHEVKVKYYEATGGAIARLTWTRVSSSAPGTIYQWRGDYFNNTYLGGTPALVRDDANINFNWGVGSPAWGVVASDQFSVRWTRNVYFNAGRYRFTTTTDDGVRLWVNNQLIINAWYDQMATQHAAEINLPGGYIPIKMEYYENYGGAVAHLNWTQVSSASITNWRGEYYNNMNLGGSPVMVRDDPTIDFAWGYGSPAAGVNNDIFSTRWTRELNFDQGRYRFVATTDDGVRLWVNNQLIINNWTVHSAQPSVGEIDLPTGRIPITMEYCEEFGLAEAHLSWARIDSQPPAGTGGPTMGFVNINYLNVRQGPGANYQVITTIGRNTAVTLTHRNANASWVRVILPNGVQGWVNAFYLASNLKPFTFLPVWNGPLPATSNQASSPTATVVNVYYLNVRRGPSLNYTVVAVIQGGQQVQLAGYRNSDASWVKIRLADGTEGWVNAYYLRHNVNLSNLTVGGW